ncbi:MAG: phosphoglycolate phosphatase [Enterobacterales bacterium]|nr:phosphoglycolate phosphatase [Enterobacterales bacterium]
MSDEYLSTEAILFDLDGTLVDSAPDLTAALNHTLKILQMEPRSEKKVRGWIGNGVEKLLHRGLTDSHNGVATGDDFWRAKNIFYSRYKEQSGQYSKLYPKVIETLQNLRQKGIRLACITNKDRCFTLPLLENLAISEYFDIVVCGDDLTNKKPHPEPLLYATSRLGSIPDQCLMVGDSASDVGAAVAAKMKVICVDYGYAQGINLSSLEINGMISNINQIEDYVRSVSLEKCG